MVVCLISRLLAHAFRLVSVAWKQKITSARVSLFHKTSSHFGTFKRKKLCQQRRAENLHFYESVFCYQTTASRKKCSLKLTLSFEVAATVQEKVRRWGNNNWISSFNGKTRTETEKLKISDSKKKQRKVIELLSLWVSSDVRDFHFNNKCPMNL